MYELTHLSGNYFYLKPFKQQGEKKVKNVHALYPAALDWKLEYKLPFVWYFWSTVAWIKIKSQILKLNCLFSINLVYSSEKLFLVLWLINTVTPKNFCWRKLSETSQAQLAKKQNCLKHCLQNEKYMGFRPDAILQHLQFWHAQKLPIKEEIFRQFLDKKVWLPPPLLPLPYSPPSLFHFSPHFFSLWHIITHVQLYIWAVEVWMC